jgi:hypothetical protein
MIHSDAVLLIKIKDSAGNIIKMAGNALFKSKSGTYDMNKHGTVFMLFICRCKCKDHTLC